MISLTQLARFGLGTSRSASLGSRLQAGEFVRFLDEAASNGVNLLDTSNFYGTGDAERLIGKTLKMTAADFFVITKGGLPGVNFPGWLSPLNQIAKKVKQKRGAAPDFSAGHLLASICHSNRRLGREADAFLLHEPGWQHLENLDSWEGLAKIRQQGLARHVGVSTNDPRVVREGIRAGLVDLVQTHAAWGEAESGEIPALCREYGIPVILNGVMAPFAATSTRFREHEREIHRMDGLEGISAVQFLIAAAIVEKQATSALSGTTNLEHLKHNLGALRYLDALQPHLAAINRLFA